MILSEPESPVPGLLLLRSSPCRTTSPSVSLVNPSKNNSPDRLEKQSPHKQADTEMDEGKQVLCTHKLTRSWDRGDFTAEAIAVVLAQSGPGYISLSQTFPRHS